MLELMVVVAIIMVLALLAGPTLSLVQRTRADLEARAVRNQLLQARSLARSTLRCVEVLVSPPRTIATTVYDTFSMTVRVPAGWTAVTQGDRAKSEDEGALTSWGCDVPQDDIYLIAAPFRIDAHGCEKGLAKTATWVPLWGVAVGILTFGIVVPKSVSYECVK